jgi:tRNA(Ile)-lysidine synthase
MSPVIDALRRGLGPELGREATTDTLICVALSGGLDSTVLLHALHTMYGATDKVQIRAVHIDHGLHPDAPHWAARGRQLCERLGVPLHIESVTVDVNSGDGPEAAARRARYAVFDRVIERDEVLLTAHHQDDQLETVLLRLLRGAGTDGLGGIAEHSRFGRGRLVRPLLELSRADLEDYARIAGLDWVEDPTNRDTSLDRNYVRHEIVPRLRERWPGLGKTLGRAARLNTEAAGLLDDLADSDARETVRDQAVDLGGLRRLEPARQRNLMRYVLKCRGFSAPSEVQLRTGLEQLMSAAVDRRPAVQWGRAHIHRYRDRLYILDFDPGAAGAAMPAHYRWDGSGVIDMGPVRGRLRLVDEKSGGVASAFAAEGIVVRFRHGGERIRESNQAHHKQLKKLFQERGIVPWMRGHVPLIYGYAGQGPDTGRAEQLLAVGDLWVAAEAVAGRGETGYRILWDQHPATQ